MQHPWSKYTPEEKQSWAGPGKLAFHNFALEFWCFDVKLWLVILDDCLAGRIFHLLRSCYCRSCAQETGARTGKAEAIWPNGSYVLVLLVSPPLFLWLLELISVSSWFLVAKERNGSGEKTGHVWPWAANVGVLAAWVCLRQFVVFHCFPVMG